LLHYELREKIIGAGMRVLNELKPKLDGIFDWHKIRVMVLNDLHFLWIFA